MILPAIRERPSPNHDGRGEPARIDMLVLHYTGMSSAAAALDRLCDAAAQVSAHYLVEEDGTVWRLVPEICRAWHAGLSSWQGESALNAVSIGIEIVNPGHEGGYPPFPEPQMAAVEALCRDIVARHGIAGHRVVGHSDIAPDRKRDPGELFDWRRLARAGIGIWPEPRAASAPAESGRLDRSAALRALAEIGYAVAPATETAVLAAFQRRFRQACCDGELDRETAARIVEVSRAFAQGRQVGQ
ncbi:MAG: N-acetylmuramoyl-L-alanine amidase [Alphaproteobacteria bacterium]|nr:N-acetylmuramoyl-L-alanine amidase [Alphaproteobacteria bacterium]